MKGLFSSIFLIAALGCSHENNLVQVPYYETALTFSCADNLSDYYGLATINGKSLCYSTNQTLYKNFAYTTLSVTNSSNQISSNQAGIDGKQIQLGVGGLGSSSVLPAPIYFYIETPLIPEMMSRFDYIKQVFQKGKSLDISIAENEKQQLSVANTKFKIGLFAQYPGQFEPTQVVDFYTWTGVQDAENEYLTVKDVQQINESSIVITVNFRCKLYDKNGRYYAQVTNGEMRFLLTN